MNKGPDFTPNTKNLSPKLKSSLILYIIHYFLSLAIIYIIKGGTM